MKKIIQIFIITLGLMHNFAAADSLGSNQINEVFSEGKIINKMTVKDFMGVYYHIVHNDNLHFHVQTEYVCLDIYMLSH